MYIKLYTEILYVEVYTGNALAFGKGKGSAGNWMCEFVNLRGVGDVFGLVR